MFQWWRSHSPHQTKSKKKHINLFRILFWGSFVRCWGGTCRRPNGIIFLLSLCIHNLIGTCVSLPRNTLMIFLLYCYVFSDTNCEHVLHCFWTVQLLCLFFAPRDYYTENCVHSPIHFGLRPITMYWQSHAHNYVKMVNDAITCYKIIEMLSADITCIQTILDTRASCAESQTCPMLAGPRKA